MKTDEKAPRGKRSHIRTMLLWLTVPMTIVGGMGVRDEAGEDRGLTAFAFGMLLVGLVSSHLLVGKTDSKRRAELSPRAQIRYWFLGTAEPPPDRRNSV